jgi:hypothetical protein
MKLLSLTLFFSALLIAQPATAQDASRASANASADVSMVAGSVVAGSTVLLVGGSILTVYAIERAGQSVVLVLKKGSEVATVSVKASAELSGKASVAVGSSIQVAAEASGYALMASGKLIAFIPNEVGKSLVHHSTVKESK